MNIETDDTNFGDIENIESIEGIIKIGNSGAPSISDLSPNSDWKCFPQSSYNSCYGLPYQDHNYGAPPPPTPPPSPGNTTVVAKKKSFEVALKSLKPNKALPEKKGKCAPKKQIAARKKCRYSKSAPTVKLAVPSELQVVPVTSEQVKSEGVVAAGDYSDSITRCICNYTHDDGYMICCDQCQVWQHIDCMGIDRNNIPEEYSCEQCMPRKVYKARARLIQKNKRDELLRSSSEDENANSKKSPNELKARTRNSKSKFGTQRNKKLTQSPVKNEMAGSNGKASSLDSVEVGSTLRTTRKNKRSTDTTVLSVDGDAEESPWSIPYDTATANQYSTDIQESLKSYRPNGTYQLESVLSELDVPRCQLRLLVNGRRGLEVDSPIRRDQALIEFKGKVLLQQQFEQENNFVKRPQPFVLFYNKWDGLKICVDATSFGNEARFVRRSCLPNSEVRHVIENGQVHLVIFSGAGIDSGSEVTIPFDFEFKSCEYCVECACVRAQCPVRKAGRKYQKCTSQSSGDHNAVPASQHKEEPVAASTTTATHKRQRLHEELKVQIPAISCQNQQFNSKSQNAGKFVEDSIKSPSCERSAAEETRRLSREDRKIEAYMKAFEKLEKMEERRKEALQRMSEKKEASEVPVAADEHAITNENLKQPSPPQTVRSKPTPKPGTATKSPSAVKPMIRRRRNRSGPVPRRRTTSSSAATISQPASDAECESNGNSLTTENTQDGLPTSRIPAPVEVGSTHAGTISVSSAGPSSSVGFRFPKTKKQILHEWYQGKGQEKPLTVSVSHDEDSMDFVKTNSSPGSSWAHMRRNSMSSNVQPTHTHATHHTPIISSRKLDTSMGSAKKRWLKQAMEEDCSNQSNPTPLVSPCNEHPSPPNATSYTAHFETPMSPDGSGFVSSTNHTVDFVTPLKKRRLARESLSLDSRPASPTLVTPTTPPDEKLADTDSKVGSTSADDDLCPVPSRQAEDSTLHVESISTVNSVSQSDFDNEHAQSEVFDRTDNIIVPEPVRACSPVLSPSVMTSDIPTTIMDVANDDCLVSPLRKYRLKAQQQSKVHAITPTKASVVPPTAILSPREPRTLGDLMHQTTTDEIHDTKVVIPMNIEYNFGSECSDAVNVALMRSPDHAPRSTIQSAVANEYYTSPRKLSTDGLSPSLCSETSTAIVKLNLGVPSPTKMLADSNRQSDLKRSVSLMESTTWYHDVKGDHDCGVSPVQKSIKQEPCGEKEYALVTPPQKKKVSLLEYRKRMQIHPPKSDSYTSVSAPTTPLIAGDTVAPPTPAVKPMQHITLPSLPLFENLKESNSAASETSESGVMKRPLISLDERLKLEFGFAVPEIENHEGESDDDSCDIPPPPPPPLPPLSRPRSVASAKSPLYVAPVSDQAPLRSRPGDNAVVFTDTDETTVENGYFEVQPSYLENRLNAAAAAQSPDESKTVSESPVLLSTESLPTVKKAQFPLKQGSLGAVMLGQTTVVSPICNFSTGREISGARQMTPLNLPKKYR